MKARSGRWRVYWKYCVNFIVSIIQFFQRLNQLIHRWTIRWVLAGMNETQESAFIHDKVTAELTRVIAVRVKKFAALKPALNVQPHHTRMM